MKRKRIIILGGGFGGVYAARRLEKLFTPMLPEVPSSSVKKSPYAEVRKGAMSI